MCFSSSSSPQTKANKAIEREMRAQRKQAWAQHKILLLGTGNSGKSTFCKQLTAKYGGENPHFQASNDEVIRSLRDNVLVSVKKLLAAVADKAAKSNQDWPTDGLKKQVLLLEDATPDNFTTEVAEAIQDLVSDSFIDGILTQYGEHLCLPGGVDGLHYFAKNATNYANPSYKHTPEDLLRNRIKTTGIIESKFSYSGSEFIICDVAGQRSERRKWINCFNHVSAILYLMSSNEYDVGIEEAAQQNSFYDAVQQFRVVSELQIFENTPFIVFFNKFDLLPEKVKRSPLSKTFKDYTVWAEANTKPDDSEVDKAVAYFSDVMKKHFKGSVLEFYTTCALDTESCAKVFESVQRSIVFKSIEATGLTLT